jgi:uroporphyrinogen-III synthase
MFADTLAPRGAHVTRVDFYSRARPQSGAEGLVEAWRERRVDAITLTSSEGLDNLWEMLDAYGRTALTATPAFVSHPRIAERAHALKLAHVIIAEPTDAGLIASLLQYFDADY